MSIRMSKSAINTYEVCPFNYKNVYINKKPMSKSLWATNRGRNIHEVYEKITKRKYGNTITEASKKAKSEHSDIIGAVSNFTNFQRAISPDGEKIVSPILTEEKIFDPDTNIVGVVDAVYSDGRHNILVDYKSGQLKPISHYRFELALYAYLVEKVKGIKIDYWGIYFADHVIANNPRKEPADRQEIRMSLIKVETIRNLINMKEFPKKPKYKCSNCISFMNGYCPGVKF